MKRPTIKSVKSILEASAKNGIYFDGALFDLEPETSLRLLDDRQALIDAIDEVLNSHKLRPDSPTRLRLLKVMELVKMGWPTEESQ